MISKVPSVDPPSSTSSSTEGASWSTTLFNARSMVCTALRTNTITLNSETGSGVDNGAGFLEDVKDKSVACRTVIIAHVFIGPVA